MAALRTLVIIKPMQQNKHRGLLGKSSGMAAPIIFGSVNPVNKTKE